MIASGFWRGVAALASGTAAAQVITVICTPFLTRMYSPGDFGLYGLYISAASICVVVSSLRYDLAILTPKQDEKAKSIVGLSLLIVLCLSIFFGLSAFLTSLLIESPLLQFQEIWQYFAVSVLLLGSLQVINRWLIRVRQFRANAIAQVARSAITNSCQLLFAWLAVSKGLIAGALVGQCIALIIALKFSSSSLGSLRSLICRKKIGMLLVEYSALPIWTAPQGLLSSLSLNMPVLVIGFYFGSVPAGLYLIADRLLRVPLTLIVQSVRQVSGQKISEFFHQEKNAQKFLLIICTVNALIFASLAAFLSVFGEKIFGFALGSQWSESGEIALYISVWYIFLGLAAPTFQVFILGNRMRLLLGLEMAGFTAKSVGLGIGILQNDYILSIYYMCVLTSVVSLSQAIYGIKFGNFESQDLGRST